MVKKNGRNKDRTRGQAEEKEKLKGFRGASEGRKIVYASDRTSSDRRTASRDRIVADESDYVRGLRSCRHTRRGHGALRDTDRDVGRRIGNIQ